MNFPLLDLVTMTGQQMFFLFLFMIIVLALFWLCMKLAVFVANLLMSESKPQTSENIIPKAPVFLANQWLRVGDNALPYFEKPDGDIPALFVKPLKDIPHVNLHGVTCLFCNLKKGKIVASGSGKDINLYYYVLVEDTTLIKALNQLHPSKEKSENLEQTLKVKRIQKKVKDAIKNTKVR